MANTAQGILQEEERIPEIKGQQRIEAARGWIDAWMSEQGMNPTAMVRAMDLGDSARTVFSKFLNNKLETDSTRIVLAIEQYRARIEGPDGISAVIGFRMTRTAQKILDLAETARDGHKMAAGIGLTGFGKTEALKQFQRTTRGDGKPPVRIVTINVLTTAQFLARKLALDMGLVERGGDPPMLLELVSKRLMSHPEFLIVDEANFLQERCLHVLRYIHDVTGTGILMAGTPTFSALVANRSRGSILRGSDNDDLGYDGPLALFADRIFTEVLPGLYEEEIVEITEDVLKAKLTEQAISKLVLFVGHNMRLLTRVIIQLREYRKRTNQKKIDDKMIDAAWGKILHLSH